MNVHAFKVGDYSRTHERQAFRKLCEKLAADGVEEDIFLIANATLPDVEYHSPSQMKARVYRGVSPDIIVLKKDAVAVVELKSYPGLITFPVEKSDIWEPWTFESEGRRGVINENGPSPYGQVMNNGQAVQAFLETFEAKFADDESKGSLWYKLQKVVLFSAANAQFASAPPTSWMRTTVCVLDSQAAAGYDIAKFLCDLTTDPIHHKTDPRPQIHLTDRSIRALASLLKAEEFKFAGSEPSVEDVVFPEYALQPIVSMGTRIASRSKQEEVDVSVPESVLGEPVPLRVLRYYIDCIQELAKQGSSIDLSKPDLFYFVQNCSESVFFGNGQFELDSLRIPDRFLTPDARFTYGYLPIIVKQIWKDHPTFYAEPLVMRDMRIIREKGRFFCQALSKDEVTVNRSAIRRFTAIQSLTTEEIEELLREVETAGSVENQIRYLLDALEVEWNPGFKQMGGYDYAALNEGLLPLALLFQSTSGMYNRLLRDMGKIRDIWSGQPESRDNLAWRILDGLAPEHVSKDWHPPNLCVIPSNFEQSQGVGLAVEDKGLLQVISGPPGTGKTQLIQNIIVNMVDGGRKVIFASRNNKAVDVVVDRMNGGILRFPFVFRTGSNDQNQRFAAFLSALDPIDSDHFLELKSQERAIRVELRDKSAKLQQLYLGLEQARKARRNIDQIDQQMEAMRDQNDALFGLTDWHDKQSTDFGASIWRRLAGIHERESHAGAGLIGRTVTSFKKGYGLGAMLNREKFEKLLQDELNRQLNEHLPAELISAIGNENLQVASARFLPALEIMNSLSRQHTDTWEILDQFDEAQILKEWSEVETSRIEPSKKLLTLQWHRRRDSEVIKSVVNLLGDSRSRTPFDDVMKVFPCCATTTLSVGNKIPLAAGLFDLAVIDEASQADVASCLPILYRARRAVIIGDEMQLRPVVTMPDNKNQKLLKAYGLLGDSFRRYDFCSSSMLDLAYDRFTAAGGRRLLLKDHYRCHPDIIDYSNRCFYDGCLRIRTTRDDRPGVFLHACEGEAHRRWSNPAEIDEVQRLVAEAIKKGYDHSQIGVVTPFRQQAEAIISQLRANSLFAGDSGMVTVSTAHGFQGDERDVMVFSLVVSDNMPPGTIRWVHDPATDSKNLLNVAITRARRELHVVANEKLCDKTGGLLGALIDHCRRHAAN